MEVFVRFFVSVLGTSTGQTDRQTDSRTDGRARRVMRPRPIGRLHDESLAVLVMSCGYVGVGWSMMLMSFMVAIYYNMIIAYILRYLFASFTTTLPWQSCRPEWIKYGCFDRLSGTQNYTAANTTNEHGSSASNSTLQPMIVLCRREGAIDKVTFSCCSKI